MSKRRLYGYTRISNHQKKRKTKKQLEYFVYNKANRKIALEFKKKLKIYQLYLDRYNDNNFYSYLSPYYLNKYYHTDKNVYKSIGYIFERYIHFDQLITDWTKGIRDIIFTKIMTMIGADFDEDLEYFMNLYHEDIMIDTMMALLKDLSGYVHTNRSSFYTYVINIFPYTYCHAFNSIYVREQKYITLKDSLNLPIEDCTPKTDLVFQQIFDFIPVADLNIAKEYLN